jgi:hypothetical protein
MPYEHMSFTVSLVKRNDAFQDALGHGSRRSGWYPSFDPESGRIVGWDEIMGHLSSEGWELVNVVPYSWQPEKKAGEVVTDYFVFAKRPV